MARLRPFIPTHILRDDIPSLRLAKGTPVRQVNPFADGRNSNRMCYTEEEWLSGCRTPWVFVSHELIELPDCKRLLEQMGGELLRK